MNQQKIEPQDDARRLVQKCYSIEDDQAAFDCIKEVIASTPGICAPRLVLLTQPGCEGCEEEKAIRKEDLGAGRIQEVDFHSERGRRIARENGIDSTPALLVLDCEDRLIDEAPAVAIPEPLVVESPGSPRPD